MSSSQPPSREKKPLGFDELIAIVIAFGAIGAIFFWVTGRNPDRFRTGSWQFPAVFSPPGATPAAPNSQLQVPAATPIPSPSPAVPLAPKGPVIPPVVPVRPPVSVAPQPEIVRPVPAAVLPKPKAGKAKVGPVKFTDVPNNYWARPFIIALADRRIFTDFADNKFRPEEPLTRAELASLIQRMSDNEQRRKPLDFKDVKDSSPVAPAIDRSVATGYLRGYPNNEFRPEKMVPRVEAIAALASGLNLKPSAKASRVLQPYTDRKKVPKWAVDKVAAAAESGIVVNHPNPRLLQPNRTATRAEVAAMIYQAMAKEGKVPAKPSKYVVRP